MSSKTKIVVLHMKEIIYTVLFAVLAIVLILLLIFMFLPHSKDSKTAEEKYMPGIYTSTVTLNNTPLEVEVTVDESHINSIRFSNLDETVEDITSSIEAINRTVGEAAISVNDIAQKATDMVGYAGDTGEKATDNAAFAEQLEGMVKQFKI